MELKFYISNLPFMYCDNCNHELIHKLNSVKEIKKASINFDEGLILVETKEDVDVERINEIVKIIENDSYCEIHSSNKLKTSKFKYYDECGEFNTDKLKESLNNIDELDNVRIDEIKKEITLIHDSNIEAYHLLSKVATSIDDDVIIKYLDIKEKKEVKIGKIIGLSVKILGIILFGLAILSREVFSNELLSRILFFIGYFTFGYEIFLDCFEDFKKKEIFNEAFLMIIASLGSLIIKEETEAFMLLFLFNIGEFLEEKAKDKAEDAIKCMLSLKVDKVTLVNGSSILTSDAKIGDEIVIKPFERIPLDSIVTEGESLVDTKMMTGESLPVNVKENSKLISGTLNLEGVITAKVEKEEKDSESTKLIELAKETSENKSRNEKFIEKFASIYTPIVISIGLLVFLLNYFILKNGINVSLNNCFVFLVISCPCALVISIPLSYASGIARLNKNGILVKGSSYLDSFSKVEKVYFDKTGTLTEGNFKIKEYKILNGYSEDEFKMITSSLESYSHHPLAYILKNFGKEFVNQSLFTNVKEIPSLGVLGFYNEKEVFIGSINYIGEEYKENISTSGSVVYLIIDKKVCGYFVLEDEIKKSSKEVIDYFERNNISVSLLSGDNEENVKRLSNDLGLKEYKHSLLPDDKMSFIKEEVERGSNVAYCGDGTNDILCLELANTGIAIGRESTDAAKKSADVVIQKDDLEDIKNLHIISKKTRRISIINIVIALVIKFSAMIIVISNVLKDYSNILMILGEFSDVGVTLICILNSLRLYSKKIR